MCYWLGYIGLPTALLLVQRDFKVIGVDVNQKVVGDLKKGKLNIKEPDLERALNIALKSGKFEIQTKASFADIFIIAFLLLSKIIIQNLKRLI